MTELLRNAWMGWFRVTDGGKVMALFLVSLLFLWIGYKQEKQRLLLRYGTISALCCIVPVTAVALMLYQTRFYDYEWIWSIVPVTVITAYAGTKVLAEYWQGFRREAWRKGLPVTMGLLAVAFLGSGLCGSDMNRESERALRAATEGILRIVGEEQDAPGSAVANGGSACIWGPRKMMEYARRLDSSILLPYGRNMWDEALRAYSYDTYSEEIENMYQWMCVVEDTCTENDFDLTDIVLEKLEEENVSTRECLDTARQAGVDYLILPGNTNQLLLNEVVSVTGIQPVQNAGYYFFRL